ncbi:MAG: HAMP domain-containing sensor histidine kinase [Actinomycetota bacterium]|nr:HAMP domain-containing sensor histidine kinase [Actinomycetota bacterium]
MTLRSPRWTATLICAAVVLVGYFTPELADRLAESWQRILRTVCAPSRGGGSTNFVCTHLFYPADTYWIFKGFVLAVALGLALLAMNWTVQPIRDLAAQIRALGPQNFAFRVRTSQRRGEMADLAAAVNDMIARVAVGYESQRRFAADAAHELRTPLAVQRTLIEVSLARNPSPERLRVVAEQLLETNERNVRLIEALLVLSESDRGVASRSLLRLDEIVADVVADHAGAAADAKVTVGTTLAPRTLIGERVLLERLVSNLVQNAVKYNRPGGTVTVTVGDRPALTVENTGDDIPPDEVAGLFEPFRRLHGARIDHSGGAGLGLTIARSIVRAHDGSITARPLGHDGLRVEVTLPSSNTP